MIVEVMLTACKAGIQLLSREHLMENVLDRGISIQGDLRVEPWRAKGESRRPFMPLPRICWGQTIYNCLLH